MLLHLLILDVMYQLALGPYYFCGDLRAFQLIKELECLLGLFVAPLAVDRYGANRWRDMFVIAIMCDDGSKSSRLLPWAVRDFCCGCQTKVHLCSTATISSASRSRDSNINPMMSVLKCVMLRLIENMTFLIYSYTQ